MTYLAHTVKGLEDICITELCAISGISIQETSPKLIQFRYEGDPKILKSLKTIDDIGIYLLDSSVEEFLSMDPNKLIGIIQSGLDHLKLVRPIRPSFSITFSRYKNHTVAEEEFKKVMGQLVSKELDFEYTPLDHSNADIRVSISEETCTLSLKLFSQSLFRRDYDHQTQLGSIRPTIAAAMLYKLSEDRSNLKVVDNLCGSGTFICEAQGMGHKVYGGDISQESANLCRDNLKKLSHQELHVDCGNAGATSWEDNSFDIAVSNFPWNEQIKVNSLTKLFDSSLKEYARILKNDARVGFITLKPDLLLKYLRKHLEVIDPEVIQVGYLGQQPTLVLAQVQLL